MNGLAAMLLKEFAHIRRDRGTIVFAFIVPVLQLTIFGYAIETTVQNIPMVVLNLDGRQESRRLVEALGNTRTLRVVAQVVDSESFRRALTSGRAKVGVLVPADYSERLMLRQQAHVQVLIDGSDSQVATTALNAVNLLAIELSMGKARTVAENVQIAPARDERGSAGLPLDVRPRLLYNPDLKSAHFFVPGLIGIILQLVLIFLTSFSIAKEREHGTLEQLFVTPVGRLALLLGKLVPYAAMAFGEMLIILVVMVALFGVPIRGSLLLLMLLSALFVVTALALGLLISTVARTQVQAVQLGFLVLMPSVLLSGFMFPRSEMPLPIYLISCVLPVTYFVEILRGVILRGADAPDLAPHITALAACCAVILGLSLSRFRKQIQ